MKGRKTDEIKQKLKGQRGKWDKEGEGGKRRERERDRVRKRGVAIRLKEAPHLAIVQVVVDEGVSNLATVLWAISLSSH